jgi:hypothetical protein
MERIKDAEFQLLLFNLQPATINESSCWYELFARSVVGADFSIPAQTEENGIELPYQVVVAFAQTRYCGA